MSTLLMTLSVDDVEEEGVVTLSDDELIIGLLVEATLTDGDGGVSGERWQWARSRNGSTNWVNISGATSASYTTVRSDAEFFLRALVTYTDDRGGGKNAEAITANRVVGENERPAFPVQRGRPAHRSGEHRGGDEGRRARRSRGP